VRLECNNRLDRKATRKDLVLPNPLLVAKRLASHLKYAHEPGDAGQIAQEKISLAYLLDRSPPGVAKS